MLLLTRVDHGPQADPAVVVARHHGPGTHGGVGTPDKLRPLNFGFEALREPLRQEPLLREIARYDPEDAALVRDLLRSSAGLVLAVQGLVAIYQDAITEHRLGPPGSNPWRPDRRGAAARDRLFLRLYWRWMSASPEHRAMLTRLPGVQRMRRGLRRLLRQGES